MYCPRTVQCSNADIRTLTAVMTKMGNDCHLSASSAHAHTVCLLKNLPRGCTALSEDSTEPRNGAHFRWGHGSCPAGQDLQNVCYKEGKVSVLSMQTVYLHRV